MANAPATATPAAGRQAAAALPFAIASRRMTRFSFNAGQFTLGAGSQTPISPVQVPAVGYLSHINLEVTVTGTGGTAPAFTADAPFNVLAAVEFKTASGNDIIVPVTGYQLYLVNKYGCQFSQAPWSDVKANRQYSATSPNAHFFLAIPLEIDSSNGLGAIPALASNRSYQLQLTLAAQSAVTTSNPTLVVTVTGTAYYWSQPTDSTNTGVAQQSAPNGLGTLSQWQLETPPITPGDKYIKSNNVGNVLRCLIFTLRNAAGARIDAAGWPQVSEVYLDNDPMFYLTQTEWEYIMATTYGFNSVAKDAALGLDTGVYVLPFFALGAGVAGDPMQSRSQYLPTLDASLLQLRGTSFGANASTLEILTNSVIPTSASVLYSK